MIVVQITKILKWVNGGSELNYFKLKK
jgi:hypothetical protein